MAESVKIVQVRVGERQTAHRIGSLRPLRSTLQIALTHYDFDE